MHSKMANFGQKFCKDTYNRSKCIFEYSNVAYYCSWEKWPSQHGTRTKKFKSRTVKDGPGSVHFLGPGPGLGNNFVLGHPWIRSGVEFPVFEILFIIFVIFKKWFTFGEKFKNVRSSNSIYFSSPPETKSISKGKIHN